MQYRANSKIKHVEIIIFKSNDNSLTNKEYVLCI